MSKTLTEGKTLTEIAEELKASDKKVQLIYAFNGMGKTRLSREFQQIIDPKNNNDEGHDDVAQTELSFIKTLCYNAFTEDLFYWDNDLKQDADHKLKIQPDLLIDWFLKDQGQDRNVIANFQQHTDDKLTPRFNSEYTIEGEEIKVKAFSEVTFSQERGGDEISENIKISKGEESNFIWSIFYSLLDLVISVLNVPEPDDRETKQFNKLEYVFIDDPVSSLDENHLIQLAVNLGTMIKSSESERLKFIISTHNPLFYNVLYNELKSESGYLLEKLEDGTFNLKKKDGASNQSFSYHLYLKQILEHAVENNKIERYHFMLLRNLYEKTAMFLGYKKWSALLPDSQNLYESRVMNFYNHNTLSNEEIAEPTAPEKKMIEFLLRNLDQYGYVKQEKQHG